MLASDGAGGAIAAWEDSRNDGLAEDIYAIRVMADGTLAAGWPPDGLPVISALGNQLDPVLAEDGEGGVIAAWGESVSGAFAVRALRLTASGSLAAGWPAAGVVLATGSRPMGGDKQIVSDGAGGAIVAWLDFRNDPFGETLDADLFAQRVRADGTIAPGWPPNGVAVCEAREHQHDMDMVQDGLGGAVVVWEDYRTHVADVYGQRVTPDGAIAPGWLTDGNPLVAGPGYQLTPRAALDGLGGVLLAFEELMAGEDYDLLAQRILLDGTFPPGWSATPMSLCTSNAHDYQPAVAPDGAGGLIVVGTHATPDSEHPYATWVPSDPVPTLVTLVSAEATSERVVLTWHGAGSEGRAARVERSSVRGQWEPAATILADGEGTFRYEDRDVRPGEHYGYRLAYAGELGEVTTAEEWVTVPAPRFALAGAVPNPVTDDLVVGFSLPDGEPARLELFDLAGRQVLAREVGLLGLGTHRLRLAGHRELPAGVYHLALTQADRRAVARAVVTR